VNVPDVLDNALGQLALGLERPGRAAGFGNRVLELREHLGHVVGHRFLLAHGVESHPDVIEQLHHGIGLAPHVVDGGAAPLDVPQLLVGGGQRARQPIHVIPGLADRAPLIRDGAEIVVTSAGDLVDRIDFVLDRIHHAIPIGNDRDLRIERFSEPLQLPDAHVDAGD